MTQGIWCVMLKISLEICAALMTYSVHLVLSYAQSRGLVLPVRRFSGHYVPRRLALRLFILGFADSLHRRLVLRLNRLDGRVGNLLGGYVPTLLVVYFFLQ